SRAVVCGLDRAAATPGGGGGRGDLRASDGTRLGGTHRHEPGGAPDRRRPGEAEGAAGPDVHAVAPGVPAPHRGRMAAVGTLLVDNYDSFTYNLFDLLARVNGEEPVVVRND